MPNSLSGISLNKYIDQLLTEDIIDQLANIGSNTISSAQWGYVNSMNQNIGSTNSPTFATLTCSTALSTDSIIEKTATAGVTIDSVLLKDNIVTSSSVKTDAITEKTTDNGVALETVSFKDGTFTNCTKYSEDSIHCHVSNLAAAATNPMGVFINQGYPPYYMCPKTGSITKLYLMLDDTDGVYTSWSAGTLQFVVYVNDVAQYTGTAYTKTTWDAADTYYTSFMSIITISGLSISITAEQRVSVAIVCNASFNGAGMEATCEFIYQKNN